MFSGPDELYDVGGVRVHPKVMIQTCFPAGISPGSAFSAGEPAVLPFLPVDNSLWGSFIRVGWSYFAPIIISFCGPGAVYFSGLAGGIDLNYAGVYVYGFQDAVNEAIETDP